MKRVAAVLTALACVSLTACQTPRHKEFAQIQDGMLKDDVVQAAGSPTRTQRWQGKDRWIYVYYPDGKTQDVKEVHFTEGKVTYKGVPVTPEVSAEDQDRRNEESNLAEEQRLAAERAAADAAKIRAAEDLSGDTQQPQPQPQPGGGGVD